MRRMAHVIAVGQVACLALLLAATDTTGDRLLAVWLGVTLAVGWLIASRLPRHPIGWLLLAVSGLFLFAIPVSTAGYALVDLQPDLARWLLVYGRDDDQSWIWLPALGILFIHVLLRFPDGRLPSPRWRWFSRTTIGLLALGVTGIAISGGDVAPGLANPAGVAWVQQREWLLGFVAIPLLASLPISLASLVVRYRRADSLERTQIRWFAWAAGLATGLYLVSFLSPDDAWQSWVFLAYTLVPASIGVAILRYRLFAIDRIISRTLAYALVTASVIGTYALVVTSISRLLPVSSALAVATATLAAAAVFRPVLRRVQGVVDRRFNRERYDAERVVEAFGARLRGATDPDAAATDLLAAVERALQPGAVGLWVRGAR